MFVKSMALATEKVFCFFTVPRSRRNYEAHTDKTVTIDICEDGMQRDGSPTRMTVTIQPNGMIHFVNEVDKRDGYFHPCQINGLKIEIIPSKSRRFIKERLINI